MQQTTYAVDAKYLAQDIKLHPSWYDKKADIMMVILTAKANQCEEFCNRLQSTKNAELVEDTSDEYWGRGL